MPYTRNTRIKQTKWKHKSTSEAQVEYRYPFTNKTTWVAFEDTRLTVFEFICGMKQPAPYNAYSKALWDDDNNEKQGVEWTKAIIDQYHKLLDDIEAVPEIIYTKYPD